MTGHRTGRARLRSLAAGVLVVLACAAAGFVVRSALTTDPSAPDALPAAPPPAAARFARAEAISRKVPDDAYVIATARRAAVTVWRSPGGRRLRTERRRTLLGKRIPLTFLVREQRKGWAKVWLPTRPNRSTGWVRRRDVDLTVTRMHLRIRRAARRLDVFEGRRRIRSFTVAIGRSVSPTPRGRYYVTDLVKTTDPEGFYGPYSLGLSAHSPVLTSFNGGNGQIGIHGTDDPASLGTDVSAGCIRIGNAVVTALARMLPLGTPVDIKP